MAARQENASETIDLKDYAQVWGHVKKGLDQIFTEIKMTKKESLKLFTFIYKYCASPVEDTGAVPKVKTNTRLRTKKSKPLKKEDPSLALKIPGKDLSYSVRYYLETFVENLLKEGKNNQIDEYMLVHYTEKWTRFSNSLKIADYVCNYLTRNYNEQNKNILNVDFVEIGLAIWRDKMYGHYCKHLWTATFKIIEDERKGQLVNADLLKSVVNSFLNVAELIRIDSNKERTMGIYKDFEKELIKTTTLFYTVKSSQFLQEHSFEKYILMVDANLKDEDRRVDRYLHYSTRNNLIPTCEKILIANYMETFCEEFHNFLKDNRQESLGLMLKLTKKIEAADRVRKVLKDFIFTQGSEAIEKCGNSVFSDPSILMRAILEVHGKFELMIKTHMENDAGCIQSLNEACKDFINSNKITGLAESNSKTPELLAKYSDMLLKKNSKLAEQTDLEESSKGILTVYRYIEDKDVFMNYYIRLFSKRAINRLSSNEESEGEIISKLKTISDAHHIRKLQNMLQDIQISRDLNESFRGYLEESGQSLNLDLKIQVLCTGQWPLHYAKVVSIPQELEQCVQKFTQFYSQKHNGRKLQWLCNHSKAEIMTNCFKNKYHFHVSTFQLAIFLQFNNSTSYTVETLQNNTQIQMNIVIHIVQNLIKARILVSETNEEDVNSETTVSLFLNYKNKRLRINLDHPLKADVKADEDRTLKSIEQDRTIVVQAALVRIMKMRKELRHQILIMETLNQLSPKFKVRIPLVKSCIAMLIEKDYLTRKEGETDVYLYVA